MGLFILSRVLFVASMVFIIGYVFGGFRHTPAIRTVTKIAAILVAVLFIGMNIFAGRIGARNGFRGQWSRECHSTYADSATHRY